MGLRPAAAQCHVQFLRRVLEQAHRDACRSLAARHAARPVPAALGYRAHDESCVQRIDGAHLVRQHALALDSLELTIHGYCRAHRFGWERRLETVFSTRPAPRWRRLLRAAPLITLRIETDGGATRVTMAPAPRHARAHGALIVRLDAGLQAQLVQAGAPPRRSILGRLLAWWAPSETDTK